MLSMKPGLGLATIGLPEFAPGAPAAGIAVQRWAIGRVSAWLRPLGGIAGRSTGRHARTTHDRR